MNTPSKPITYTHNFDSLPDSAFVRLPVVKELFSCGKTTAWRMVNKGVLPQPHKMGRNTLWNVGDLRKALQVMKEIGHAR